MLPLTATISSQLCSQQRNQLLLPEHWSAFKKASDDAGVFLFLGILYILCYTTNTGWRPLLNRQSRRCPSVSTSGPSIPPSYLQNLILFSIKKPLCEALSFRCNFSSIGYPAHAIGIYDWLILYAPHHCLSVVENGLIGSGPVKRHCRPFFSKSAQPSICR